MAHRILALVCVALAVSALACGNSPKSGDDDDDSLVKVGDTRQFWVWDLTVMPPTEKQIDATARRITDHTYLFVEDTLWNDGTVTDAMLQDLDASLEDQTPAGSIDSAQGIVDNNTTVFGPIPDALDQDPNFYILLMNIEPFQTFQFDGFFRDVDQMDSSTAVTQTGYHSNEVEMLFVNAKIRAANDTTTKSVIAHEMLHLIEWGLDDTEDAWMKETMGEVAMTVNGYYTDGGYVADYMGDPGQNLKGNGFSVHYGACLLWGNYLLERFGVSFISDLIARTSHGETAITEQLTADGAGIDFEQLFAEWVAHNGSNTPAGGVNSSYQFAPVPEVVNQYNATQANLGPFNVTAEAFSARYLGIAQHAGMTLTADVAFTAPTAGRLALVRYQSSNRDNVDFAFPTVAGDGSASFTIDLTGAYDRARLGVIGWGQDNTGAVTLTVQ